MNSMNRLTSSSMCSTSSVLQARQPGSHRRMRAGRRRAQEAGQARVDGVELDKSADPVVSPFTKATVHRSVGEAPEGADNELTRENVDRVLNQIRGYLFADGGDIDVVDVHDGNVFVRFQGNCASCGSQETTMAMGVERSLKAAFGDKLNEVVRLDPLEAKEPSGATVSSVNALLDLLRPAIKSYGGHVKASSVEDGVCMVEYNGPEPIWKGVQSAIKDRFSDVTDVQRAPGAPE